MDCKEINVNDFLPMVARGVLISHTVKHKRPCQHVLEKILGSVVPLHLLFFHLVPQPSILGFANGHFAFIQKHAG